MKWVLIALIVVGTTFLGYKLGEKYLKRFKLYTELCRFCGYYLTSISFKNAKLKDVVESFSANRELQQAFNSFFSTEDVLISYLSTEENANLKTFLYELGRGDVIVEESRVGCALALFKKAEEQAAEDKKKYYSMYTKLGLLLGLLIAILLA